MAEHNELGAAGEQEALDYLAVKGYTLRERNWRAGHLEIDIVAEWYGEIVFVEVKTRRDENFAPASEAVTLQKKRNLVAAGRAYLAQHQLFGQPYCYDVITVVGTAHPFTITHLHNAYTEGEVWEESRRKRAFKV